MSHLPKVRLTTTGLTTKVFVDDQEIRGVTFAMFMYKPTEIPRLMLEINALDIEIDTDRTDITVTNRQQTNSERMESDNT